MCRRKTHLATLVLSTFFNGHAFAKLWPWLAGRKTNGEDEKPQQKRRLLETYVAMTRPSRLLCLAVPRSVLDDGKDYEKNQKMLTSRGWKLAEVVDGVAQTLG